MPPSFISIASGLPPAVTLAPSVPGHFFTEYADRAAQQAPMRHGGHGGRPLPATSPGSAHSPHGPAIAHRPLAPFYSPMGAGAGSGGAGLGGGFGSNPDAMLAMMRPMMSMYGGNKRSPEADPNVIPAVKHMLDLAIPKGSGGDDDILNKAVTFGAVIAGMGGVHGLRGHTLKRLAGCAQDSMMSGNKAIADMNPFKKKG